MTAKISDLLIPTECVQIEWAPTWRGNEAPATIVYWRPERGASPYCNGWRIIHANLLGHRTCSDGACCSDWGRTGRFKHFGDCTPEHIFAGILAETHHHDPDIWKAAYWETVRQFARIKGCPWARRMLEQRRNRELSRDDLAPYAISQMAVVSGCPWAPSIQPRTKPHEAASKT